MKIYAGTSGYSYKGWKGEFYPEDLPAAKMLEFYGTELPSVEINNTFYRLPKTSVVETWASQVPEDFRFVIKATRRITHLKRLRNAREEVEYLLDTISVLGDRLGVVLFQLPPNFKKDLERLEDFLDDLPRGTRGAFEFRHETWLDEDVYALLRKKNCALCIADTEEQTTDFVGTADWGYLRLRRKQYTKPQLKKWLDKIRSQNWDEVYVFFKHEEEATGPKLAKRFLSVVEGP